MEHNKVKTMLNFFVYGLIALVQLALVITVFVLEYLTNKKAGVMRHVFSRGLQYKSGIYSQQSLLIQSIVAVVLIVVFALMFVNYLKKHSKFIRFQIFLGMVMSMLVFVVINSGVFNGMMSYYYLIMASEIMLLIQIIIIGVLVIHKAYKGVNHHK